jgi:hypothetical protein
MLEKIQSGLLGGFEILFDDLPDHFAFVMPKVQGFVVGQSTTHVPAHFQRFVAYGFGLLIHVINYLGDPFRI